MSQIISHCAPERENYFKKHKSCLTLKELQNVANQYNQSNQLTNPIPKSRMQKQDDLTSALKNAYKCKEDRVDKCILHKNKNIRNLKDKFRPIQPYKWKENKNEWLSSVEIEEAMKQYEKAYKTFQFLGVYSIDFAKPLNNTGVCVSREMCKFIDDLKKKQLNKNIKRFGLVLNLDKHNEPGSHWVSIYCDLRPNSKKFGVFYYDSVGDKYTKEVKEFFDYIKNFVSSNKFIVSYNKKQQQFQNSECGVFAMTFIIKCLSHDDKTFSQCIDEIPTDKHDHKINNLRNELFLI